MKRINALVVMARKILLMTRIKNEATPKTIKKAIGNFDLPVSNNGLTKTKRWGNDEDSAVYVFGNGSRNKIIGQLTKMMEKAAKKMEYDKALVLREQIRKIKNDTV